MNKKLLLTPLCVAIFTMQAQGAAVYDKDGTQLDIFGHFSALGLSNHAARVIKSATEKKNQSNTLLMAVNFGVSGRTKINDQLYAIGVSEWQMPTGSNGSEKIKARYQYVGLDAQQYGTLTLGRGDNAYYTVAGVTDIFDELDMRVNDHYAFGDQLPGLVMYSISAMGWDVRASYQFAQDEVNDTPVNIKNGAAFSVATRTANGFSVSYGISYYDLRENDSSAMKNYYSQNMTKMYTNDDGLLKSGFDRTPSWKTDRGISIAYGNFGEGFYAALNYTRTKYSYFTHHINSIDAVAAYSFDNGITISGGYGVKRFNDKNIISDLNLGAYYKVTENFKVFAEATFDINSKPDEFYTEAQIKKYSFDKTKALIGAEYAY